MAKVIVTGEGTKITRNQSKKIMEGIRKTGFGKELAQLGGIIEAFSGMGPVSNPYKAVMHDHAMSTQKPMTLSYGPATLFRVHDRGPNGHKNIAYLGQSVIIEEITDYRFFGIQYKCRYVGDDHLDGEYVNNTMFTDYHLVQNANNYIDLYNKEEAIALVEGHQASGNCANGTLQEDDDGNEFWRVMVWTEDK